ncbi:phosphatidic acid phosphatase type 2/haloperoxidase, partial [Trametes cingulata]
TNAIVTTLTGSFLLYTRSAGVAYFTAGALLCSITVKILKRCFRQPRPVIVNGRRKKTYGMPSTHSATITYFATYITLACVYLPIHPSLPASPSISRFLPPLVVVPLASTIAVSRIWLGHHTWPQVAAGCAYGLLFAPVWFKLWTGGWNEYGRTMEEMIPI